MTTEIQILRNSLIEEATNSPKLLSDLAGLEEYVSESYNCRSFIELLQNADDAGAKHFYVKRYKDYLLVANDGRPFNINDMESLCRSASSTKVRGTSIGYRGIGFKSVVSIAKEVHLISGEYEVSFSKDLSLKAVPQAIRVPLIRIPHDLKNEVRYALENEISDFKAKGYNTIFVFSDAVADQIDEEYTSFSYTTLLFLNSIKSIDINLKKSVGAVITLCSVKDNIKQMSIMANNIATDWLVYSGRECNIAFLQKNKRIIRLEKTEAIIHAFLPTEDSCGLGVIVNGDFSTDPSRRHLIIDDSTNKVINNLTELYCSLLKEHLFKSSQQSYDIVSALIPHFDIILTQLSKLSFEKKFAAQIKDVAKVLIPSIKKAPSWFNASDFYKMASAKGDTAISSMFSDINGLDNLLKYMGVENANSDELLKMVEFVDISISGYTQLVAFCIKHIQTKQKSELFCKTPIFISSGELRSLYSINAEHKTIDDSFLQLLYDIGVSKEELRIAFLKLSLKNIEEQFKNNISLSESPNNKNDVDDKNIDWFESMWGEQPVLHNVINAKRWRSAEENAMYLLNARGFNLVDVSSQNIGYDLEGTDPNNSPIFIEVKSIDYAGQKFRMTNNEFAVAQYKKDCYFIAIVLQNANSLEICLIKDPVNRLQLNRQCIQWVWECSNYEYNPVKFSI